MPWRAWNTPIPQIIALVIASNRASPEHKLAALSGIESVFRLDVSGFGGEDQSLLSSGVCIQRGMTPVSVVFLQMLTPVGVAVALVVVMLVGALLSRVTMAIRLRRRLPDPSSTSLSASTASVRQGAVTDGWSASSSPSAAASPATLVHRELSMTPIAPAASPVRGGTVTAHTAVAVPATRSSVPRLNGSNSVPVYGHLLRAGVALLLFGYSSLVTATVKLLVCVRVPGEPSHKRFLFIDATRECSPSGWQVNHRGPVSHCRGISS
jgi:hypothetical protein